MSIFDSGAAAVFNAPRFRRGSARHARIARFSAPMTHDCGDGIVAELRTQMGACVLRFVRDGVVVKGSTHVSVWYTTPARPLRIHPLGRLYGRVNGDETYFLPQYGEFELRNRRTNKVITTLSFPSMVQFGGQSVVNDLW